MRQLTDQQVQWLFQQRTQILGFAEVGAVADPPPAGFEQETIRIQTASGRPGSVARSRSRCVVRNGVMRTSRSEMVWPWTKGTNRSRNLSIVRGDTQHAAVPAPAGWRRTADTPADACAAVRATCPAAAWGTRRNGPRAGAREIWRPADHNSSRSLSSSDPPARRSPAEATSARTDREMPHDSGPRTAARRPPRNRLKNKFAYDRARFCPPEARFTRQRIRIGSHEPKFGTPAKQASGILERRAPARRLVTGLRPWAETVLGICLA